MSSAARIRILDAANALFLQGGAGAVTMRAVADRVGVTATALYRHFENKDALLNAVLTVGFQSFGGYLYRALRGATPGERLKLAGQGYLDFALEQPQLYRTIFMTPRPETSGCPPNEPQWHATLQFLVDRVRECMEAGLLLPGEPFEVAVTIWSHVHGLVSLQLVGGTGLDEAAFRAAYAASLERLFFGLLAHR